MVIGHKVYRADTSSDSMKWAKENIELAPDGALFLADILTHAHGRQGREWQVSDGQIFMTILLKPSSLKSITKEDLPLRLNHLNMALSLGILEPLEKYGVVLKWPNDFFILNKKVGGMLLEAVWHGSDLSGIILGFAINVDNIFEPTDPLHTIAISLQTALGETVDKQSLHDEIIITLDKWYAAWNQGGFDHIFEQWNQHQGYHGKWISVHNKSGLIVEGMFDKVLYNGDLVIKDNRGTETTVSFYTVERVEVRG